MTPTGTITDYLWPWLKKVFCQHRHTVYEGPKLMLDKRGHPYVLSKSYCADCGEGVPFPPCHDRDAGARLLMEYRAGKFTRKRNSTFGPERNGDCLI
jgi:hypothetical protein